MDLHPQCHYTTTYIQNLGTYVIVKFGNCKYFMYIQIETCFNNPAQCKFLIFLCSPICFILQVQNCKKQKSCIYQDYQSDEKANTTSTKPKIPMTKIFTYLTSLLILYPRAKYCSIFNFSIELGCLKKEPHKCIKFIM